MLHAVKEHDTAGADMHLENGTVKHFWWLAQQHPSASFHFVFSASANTPPSSAELLAALPALWHIPDSCRKPNGDRNVCSQTLHTVKLTSLPSPKGQQLCDSWLHSSMHIPVYVPYSTSLFTEGLLLPPSHSCTSCSCISRSLSAPAAEQLSVFN